jgi:hypothetical protein
MMKLSRKIVVFIAMSAFLLNAVGAVLCIHLAQHSRDCCQHDEKHCSICQQAAVNKPQAVVLNNAISFELPAVVYTNICTSEIVIQNSDFRIPHLRAPPIA